MGKATLLTHLKACAEAAKGVSELTRYRKGGTHAVTEALEEMDDHQRRTSRSP